MPRLCGPSLLLSTVLLALFLSNTLHVAAPSVGADARLQKLASDWEPELYAELGTVAPQWVPGLRTPCVRGLSGLQCVPGAFIIGNWQSNAKGFAALVASHPNASQVGNDRCFQSWSDDGGGRRWLRRPLPQGVDPRHQLVLATGCVTQLIFYPGFAGRFHKCTSRDSTNACMRPAQSPFASCPVSLPRRSSHGSLCQTGSSHIGRASARA